MIRRGLLRERPYAVLMIKRLADLGLTLLCGLVVHRLLDGRWEMDGATRELMLYTLLGGVVLFDLSGLYRSSTRGGRLLRELEMLLMSWGALFMAYLVVNWLIGLDANLPHPWWMPLTAVTSFVSQLVFRDLSARALGSLRARGFNRKRIAIAVASDLGRSVSAQIKAQPGLGIDVVGRVPLRDIVRETTDLIEQLCINAALQLTGDNRASAAEMLGLSRQSLYIKLRRFGIKDTPGDDVAPE